MIRAGAIILFALVASATIAPPPPVASAVRASDVRPGSSVSADPAKARALEIMKLLSDRDEKALRAFAESSFSAGALKNKAADDRLEELINAGSAIRDVKIIRWERVSPLEGRLVYRNGLLDRLQIMGVKVEATPPYAVADWSRPTNLPSQDRPPANSEEVAARLRTFVKRLAGYGYFSGTVVLDHGKAPLLSGAYGLAERNFETPNQLDTKFQIESMTKMFTAVAVGQLVEQGKLSLEDPLSKFVPDAGGGEKIRIKHLLSHTAGLGDLFNGTDFFNRNPRKFRKMSDYFEIADKAAPKLAPGTDWQYSNVGYLYLGRAIEQASGQDYNDYIQDHIFGPAGMKDSGFWDYDRPVPMLASLYEWRGDAYKNVTGLTGLSAMPFGGAISTAGDIAKFGHALLAGKLLKPETVKLFTSPKPDLGSPFYGYGFFYTKFPRANATRWGHGGNAMGGCSQFMIVEGDGLPWTFVTLSNGGLANCRLVYEEASRLILAHASRR